MKNILRSLFFGLFLIFAGTSLNAQTEIKKNIWVDSTFVGKGTYSNPLGVNSDSLEANLPYKVYTAIVTQSGTNAPVPTILENTLGATPTWTRAGAGNYKITLTDAFTIGKSFVLTSTDYLTGNIEHMTGGFSSNDFYEMYTYNLTNVASDGGYWFFELRVYN